MELFKKFGYVCLAKNKKEFAKFILFGGVKNE
jgi:hypothetical protein